MKIKIDYVPVNGIYIHNIIFQKIRSFIINK